MGSQVDGVGGRVWGWDVAEMGWSGLGGDRQCHEIANFGLSFAIQIRASLLSVSVHRDNFAEYFGPIIISCLFKTNVLTA